MGRAKVPRKRRDTPGSRPLRALGREELLARFEAALVERDGLAGAHCTHELWMGHEPPLNIERMLGLLWRAASESVPEWLPMRYVEGLPLAYEVAARFERPGRGRSNIYLVLLDYEDSPRGPHGVYVGTTQYAPAARFDSAQGRHSFGGQRAETRARAASRSGAAPAGNSARGRRGHRRLSSTSPARRTPRRT